MADSKFKTSAEIEEEFRKITAVKLGVALDDVVLPASFIDDLKADSLDSVELVMDLEDTFGCEIPDDAAETLLTVGDAVQYTVNQYAHNENHEGDYTSSVLAFKIGEHGKIEVGLKGTDGSWVFVDAAKQLPCGIY